MVHASAVSGSLRSPMGCQKDIYPMIYRYRKLFTDIGKWITDIGKWITDIGE